MCVHVCVGGGGGGGMGGLGRARKKPCISWAFKVGDEFMFQFLILGQKLTIKSVTYSP